MTTHRSLPDAGAIARRFPAIARHAERLVLPLTTMCDSYLPQIVNARHRTAMQSVFAKLDLPAIEERYSSVQAEHLAEQNLKAYERWLEFKYLDFPFWFAAKWQTAAAMNLQTLQNRGRVFDIGSGPGHFATVCKLSGVGYLGIDVPLATMENGPRQHVYNDLRDIFPYERETYAITPDSDMKAFGHFDRVTCQMGIFCSHRLPTGENQGWSLEEWQNFLPRLMENTVKPGGEVYLQLSRDFVHGEIAKYLAAQSWQARLDTNVFRIRR